MRKLCACILLLFVFFALEPLRAQEVSEGGVTIRAGRILNGERSGRRFYGYSSVDLVFPQRNGGILSFAVWNDQHRTRPSTTNYLVFVLGDRKYTLESYSTPLDLKEFFVEQQGEWGPGGGSRVRISIPPQLEKLNLNYEGSETGIEISDVRFSPGSSLGRPVEYEQAVNTNPDTYLAFGRTQHGAESHTIFSGYSGGEIALPNRRGGMLSFRFWNDQHRTRPYTLNLLTARVGERYYSFEQYTTPLDLKEFFTEGSNEWGPAGGSEVRLQVPSGVPRVILSYANSDTGFEISNAQFSSGSSLGREFQYDEAVNWTDRTFNTFGRVLTGQRSGKKFYGYSSAMVVLPHRKGGVLRFTAWNDQHRTRPTTRNFFRYTYANVREAVTLLTSMSDLGEFYLEMANEWGPAGGRTLELAIPPGISHVDIAYDGSDTGIEISNLQFTSRPGQTVIAGAVAETPYPVTREPARPVAEIAPSEEGTPEVAAVDPARVTPGSQVNLRVTGRSFSRGATLSFLNPGIEVLETIVSSAGELTARIHIAADALTGATSLYVVNPNSRLGEFRFEVATATPARPPAPSGPPGGTSTQGLVAWWKFDEGSGSAARDSSGNNHMATLTNGPAWTRGKAWGALSFYGRDDYVATGLDVQPAAMPETTWVAWVQPVRVRYSDRQHILSSDDGGYDRAVIIETDTSNFGVATGTGIWQPVAASPNEWQHIAVVYTPSRIEFYKNGVRFLSASAPRGQVTRNKLEIGRNPSFGKYFQGLVGDVRVFNRALSAAEVQAIYQSANR